ncbi:MAG: DUF1579 domain-containing protein [Bryobacteraceae bacterium]
MTKTILLMFALVAAPLGIRAQSRPPEPAKLIAAQRDAMKALSFMDGVWRGTAWTILQSGQKHTITQTERMGPFLDGSIKLVEGRGYEPDGRVSFNAFGSISYDVAKGTYTMHSYAQGMVGDFELKVTPNGYVWEIPAGPMTIRYTAVVKDGTYLEVGDQIRPGKEPVRIFEMSLKRVGDTDWPAAGAISPK